MTRYLISFDAAEHPHGQTIAATTVTRCGPLATFQVLANSVTDFLVDVIGYYQ